MKAWAVGLLLAYVMPPYSVLRRMAESRDDLALSALKVEATATVPAASAAALADALGVTAGPGELQLAAVVAIRFPGRCRLELSSLESTKTIAAVSSNGKRRQEGTQLPALQVAVDQICAVLALRGAGDGDSRAAVERHLSALKVDTKQCSLARYDGTLAYVVGDRAPASSQLWVYKDDKFHPGRVRYKDDQGVAWDVKFKDYASQANDWFPRVVEIWKADALQLRLSALAADSRAKLDDASF